MKSIGRRPFVGSNMYAKRFC